MPWATIPLLALSAVGTGLSVDASAQDANAANKAANNELALQQQYAKQGQSAFANSLAQSTPQAVQQQNKAGQAEALQNYAALNTALPVQPVNTGTSQSDKASNAIIGQKIGQANQSSADLAGYNASSVAQWIKDLQAQTQLGQIGSFAGASENTLPLQLQQAANSGNTLSGIGSILSSIGGLGALYGAVNGGGGSSPTYGPYTNKSSWSTPGFYNNFSIPLD